LKNYASAVLYHHEKINGSGYPSGIKGDEIPLFARILTVADAYDAMTTKRPYRKALSKEEAIEELRRCAGKDFDSKISDVMIEIIEEESVAGC
jgi:HD-GYP domain-containing protein (c-di-GMP phosphodiesterase class II)